MFKNIVPLAIAGFAYLASASLFTVNEWEKAIMFRLGEVVGSDYQPGLHFKMPFVNNVKTFDARIQTMDSKPERFLTLEKKNLEVDSFVKWKISDVERFFTSMGGDYRNANIRLSQIIKDGLRAEFGSRTVSDVISGERDQVMKSITASANEQAKEFGIEITDVRIKRVDLPREVSDSVYRRMEAERMRVAKDLRSQGAEASEKIRADAERQRTVILADAYRESETLRGEGDKIASQTYAKAFTRDEEFYRFYRSTQAYQQTFKDKSDVIILDPQSQFFDYFKNANPEK